MTPPTPSTLLDHDTQVYYLKRYRQFWASGPAAAVAVVAGVSDSLFQNDSANLGSLLSKMSRHVCNRKLSPAIETTIS